MTKGVSIPRGARRHANAVAVAGLESGSLNVDVSKRETIGVRQDIVESSRKDLANIATSATLLSPELIPRSVVESWMSIRRSKARRLFTGFQEGFRRCATGCPVRSAVRCRGHAASPHYRFGHAGSRAGCNLRYRKASDHQEDTVSCVSASERTNRYRASSGCTRGVSCQTRM